MNKETTYLLEDFKKHLNEHEEDYKHGARDSIEYPLGYEEVKLLLKEIERLKNESRSVYTII